MKRRSILWLVALTVAVSIVGCSERPRDQQQQTTSSPSSSPVEVSVRLKWLYFSNYSGAVIAKERGFFPEHWEVEVHTGGFEADSIKMVASGSDDFGLTSGIELLQARAKGVPLVALCADFQKSPVSFLTLKSSGIQEVTQFRGKRVGIKYGTDTELVFRALMQLQGLSARDITEVPVKFATLPLVEQQVDIFPSFYMTDPVNLEEQGIALNFINPDDYGMLIYGNVLFTTEKTLDSRPDVVRTFVDAYVRGWQWAVENPEETGRIFEGLNDKVPAANQVKILKRTVPFLLVNDKMDSFGRMEAKRWQATLDVLKQDPSASSLDLSKTDVATAFTNDFLRGAQ